MDGVDGEPEDPKEEALLGSLLAYSQARGRPNGRFGEDEMPSCYRCWLDIPNYPSVGTYRRLVLTRVVIRCFSLKFPSPSRGFMVKLGFNDSVTRSES